MKINDLLTITNEDNMDLMARYYIGNFTTKNVLR